MHRDLRPLLTPAPAQKALVYHFCRLQWPDLNLSPTAFEEHLFRCFKLYEAKQNSEDKPVDWPNYLANFYAVDWFLCIGCLEGQSKAWELLFAARANRSDSLFIDALRARAARLFPHNIERQEMAVTDFWGFLLAGERDGGVPVLARYDGQRPLIPWLIRVFYNKHLSDLRQTRGHKALPEEDLDAPLAPLSQESDARWHEEFRHAAREWISSLKEEDALLLGLRLRYRLSQRQVAGFLGIHEGNVSRHTSRLRDECLESIGRGLMELGWTGEDLSGLVLSEMDSLILEEPLLSADRLAALLAAKGKRLPGQEVANS